MCNAELQWQNIGVLSGVPINNLKEIALEFDKDVGSAMQKMIFSYVRHSHPPVWETIISAVRCLGYIVVAQHLEKLKAEYANHEKCLDIIEENELAIAFRKLYPFASQWRWIGSQLGLEPHVLQNIEHDYKLSVDCLREMLYSCSFAGCPLMCDTIKEFIDRQVMFHIL